MRDLLCLLVFGLFGGIALAWHGLWEWVEESLAAGNGWREVRGCSACGENHPIYFVRLDEPNGDWTHVGICPKTSCDVLMYVVAGTQEVRT